MLYICTQYRIRVVNLTTEIITTFAGGGLLTGENVDAKSASMSCSGLVVHNGIVYYSEGTRVRKIENNTISTIAGAGAGGMIQNGVPALLAASFTIRGISIDKLRNMLYIGMDKGYPSYSVQISLTTGILNVVNGTFTNYHSCYEFDEQKNLVYVSVFDGSRFHSVNVTSGVNRHLMGDGTQGYKVGLIPGPTASLQLNGQFKIDRENNLIYVLALNVLHVYNRSDEHVYAYPTPFGFSGITHVPSTRQIFLTVGNMGNRNTGNRLSEAFLVCKLGTFGTFPTCQKCPMGHYADVVNASSCTPCPAGRYSSAIMASSFSTCQPCPPGMFSTFVGATSSAVCTPCPMFVSNFFS